MLYFVLNSDMDVIEDFFIAETDQQAVHQLLERMPNYHGHELCRIERVDVKKILEVQLQKN